MHAGLSAHVEAGVNRVRPVALDLVERGHGRGSISSKTSALCGLWGIARIQPEVEEGASIQPRQKYIRESIPIRRRLSKPDISVP
jgi:hypothetical protein